MSTSNEAAAAAEASTVADGPPSDYRLLLPDAWWRLPLEPENRERAVNALVEHQFKGIDNAPHLKQDARDRLLAEAEQGYRNGGIELYLSFQTAGPLTIPASLLVTLIPPEDNSTGLAELLLDLTTRSPAGSRVTMENLPCGPAVRYQSRTETSRDDSTGAVVHSTAVDYYLAVPNSGAILLLSFSTPMDAIAHALVELFDAVAKSFVWQGTQRADTESPTGPRASVTSPTHEATEQTREQTG